MAVNIMITSDPVEYDAVKFCRYSSTFWRNLLPPFQGRRTILYTGDRGSRFPKM